MDKIYFYAPTESQKKLLEINYLDSWQGTHSNFTAWIAQTYFHLKNAGFPCEITDTIQQKGIVIADRDTLGNTALPNLLCLICVKALPVKGCRKKYIKSNYQELKVLLCKTFKS